MIEPRRPAGPRIFLGEDHLLCQTRAAPARFAWPPDAAPARHAQPAFPFAPPLGAGNEICLTTNVGEGARQLTLQPVGRLRAERLFLGREDQPHAALPRIA